MANKRSEPGLAALLGATSTAPFLERSWPVTPHVVHGLDTSVRALRHLSFLQSLEAMLNAWPEAVHVHLPDRSDEASSIEASPKDARKLFANRMGLLFNQVERISPVLKSWLEGIQRDLGLPKMTFSRCMVYATPDGEGTAAHFDQNINFVLQLTGTKNWWLAPNASVQHPSQRHTLGMPVDALASYQAGPMPKRAPKGKRHFELRPGSVLFVPQGYWHGTEASGEALSLNFTYSQPSFADLFATALKSRLLLSPEWRALADGASSSDASKRGAVAAKLSALLFELSYDIPNWRAADILGATEGWD